MQKMNLLVCLLLFAVANCTAPVSPSPCLTSSVGNRFVFGIIGLQSVSTGQHIHLHITPSDQVQTHVRIIAPFINMDKVLNVTNYTIFSLNATQAHLENGKQFKGIEVSSDVSNISIHVETSVLDNEEGFLALPVNALGTRYIASSYKPYSSYKSEILVVGVESDTDVLLSSKIDGHFGTNESFRLQKLESYQFKANNDISGSVITSNKPIAVISGSAIAQIPVGIGDMQYLIEQMVPTKYWTTRFIIPPIYPRKYFVLRLFADHDNTEIQYHNSTKQFALNMTKGSMEEVVFGTDTVVVIANKPVSVIQYGHDGDNIDGDPFMSTAQGISQYADSYKFISQNTYHFSDTVAITIQKNNVSGLVLNGYSVSHYKVKDVSVPPPMDQYITMCVKLSYGKYFHLHHREGLKFGAIIYGIPGNAVGYGYPLQLTMDTNECNVPSHVTSTVASASSIYSGYSTQTASFGDRFVFGIIGFQSVITGLYIHLHITTVNQEQARVRITAPFINEDKVLNISNYTISCLNATQVHFENGKQFKGIEVSSNVNISVHVVTSDNDREEGFLALPVKALSNRYITSSYNTYANFSNEVLVVGVESDTDVFLHTNINGNSGSNESFRLQKFESYQFKSNGDLSGSVITSNKPIAIISGSANARVPVGIGDYQYLIEQMVPTKYWTTRFIIPPIYPRKYFVLRFLSDHDKTEIQYYNSSKHYAVYLSRGSVEEVLFATDPVVVIANKPISVIQYGHDGDNMAGDPFMSTAQGISQYADKRNILQAIL